LPNHQTFPHASRRLPVAERSAASPEAAGSAPPKAGCRTLSTTAHREPPERFVTSIVSWPKAY
jgi:hypothetical protein